MTSRDEQLPALRALTGARSLEDLAAAEGTTVEAIRAGIRAYLAEKASLGPTTVPTRVRRGAEILHDRRGVPHIYADDAHDLFFALGYAQAQDRLWQLDYLRRMARGTLSAVYGREMLESDILSRTLGIGRIADAVTVRLGPDSALATTAFADGVNAWMRDLPAGLPVEFELLDYEPEPWQPSDSIAIQRRWWWYLTGRLQVLYVPELVRHAVGDGDRADAFALPDGEVRYIVSSGHYPTGPRWPEGHAAAPLRPPLSPVQEAIGSNNWAVAAGRSATGQALLASDPHVYFSVPTDWYEAHLVGGGYDVAGLAYPATPALMFGRNRDIAWGLTNNICSLRDLFVEHLRPDGRGEYRRGGAWVPLETAEEVIPVRGAPGHRLTIRATDHGPIVDDLVPEAARPSTRGDRDGVLALRWVGQEFSDETQCLLDLDRAGDVDAAREALRGWRCPTFNFGLADSGGRVRYQAVGAIPLRGREAPGFRDAEDPADAWQGYIPFDGLPALDNPERGWVASANNPTAPADYPYPLAGKWSPDDRAARIERLLAATPAHTIETCREIQTDVHTGRAARGLPALLDALGEPGDSAGRAAVAALRAWDARLTTDSVGATIFNTVFWRFHARVLAARFDRAVAALVEDAGAGLTSALLQDNVAAWFANDETRVAAIRAAFAEALDWLAVRLGPDPTGWTWGSLHTLGVQHPAARTPLQHEFLDVAPRPQAGGQGTVASAGFAWADGFRTAIGANYRLLVDLAAVGGGMETVSYPGQSGQPGSPHYADQVDRYLAHRYFAMPFDRAAVDAAAEWRGRLVPASVPTGE